MNIQTAILNATAQLKQSSESPRLDVETLFCYVLDLTRAELYAYSSEVLDNEQLMALQRLLEARQKGAPIAYLVGSKEFWSLELMVTADTLIPRAETEMLVEKALNLFAEADVCKVLELGTGSGAVSVALAHERPNWHVVATDIDEAALTVAEANAKKHDCRNIVFQQSDWYQDLYPEAFDMIISNPPYIAEHEEILLSSDVHYEPRQALFAGNDGLNAINLIVSGSDSYLSDNGFLLLEHGFEQGEKVRKLLKNNNFSNVISNKDLAGIERITTGQKCQNR